MIKQRLIWILSVVLLTVAACGAGAPDPTATPNPTYPPRTPPTPLPTPVDAGALVVDEPLTVELPGATMVVLTYEVDAPQTANLTAQALTDDGAGNVLDVVLEVLDSNMNRVAYDDDGGRFVDGLADSDAAIISLELSAGAYTVRINVFNGFQAGQVSVLLEEVE